MDQAVNAIELTELGNHLRAGTCQYVVNLADPDNNFASVEFGDPHGRTISCYIAYGYRPMFLDFLGSTGYAIVGNCISGLPQVDSVLVLDLSGSVDDQTAVTFVRREWIHSPLGSGGFAAGKVDPNNLNSGGCGIIQYVSLYCPALPHTLANYLGWNYSATADSSTESSSAMDNSSLVDGSEVNVLPPQNLDKARGDSTGAITHPMYFDAYLRSHYRHYDSKIRYLPWEASVSPYYRAKDYASPPGNCDLSVGLGGNGDAITDMAGNAVTFYHGASAACPQINAFSDLTWQYDGNNYFGYQPAAPGALHGLAENDTIPSPDQQTFTDLVVNIADPGILQSDTKSSYGNDHPLIGPDYFVGFSYTFPSDEPDLLLRDQTFDFPNIAVVVEAARGNLESTPGTANGLKNAQLALIDRPVSVDGTIFDMRSIALKDGYQRAYQRLAMRYTQPLGSILAAVDHGYLQRLHKFADCRFGLVAFSSAGPLTGNNNSRFSTFGTMADKSISLSDSRSFYIFTSPYGNADHSSAVYDCGLASVSGLNTDEIPDGSGQGFRIPRIALDVSAENYLDIVSKNKLKNGELNYCLNAGPGANGIYNCRAQSVTDSGEALETARAMFHAGNYNLSDSDKKRGASRKVIVFITDGEPTDGLNGKQAQIMLKAAGKGNGSRTINTCEADGIAIFTIGLNMYKGKASAVLKEHQLNLLGDNPPEQGQISGIAWRAGHGGRYYPCESLSQLNTAFSDIARRFTQCQR